MTVQPKPAGVPGGPVYKLTSGPPSDPAVSPPGVPAPPPSPGVTSPPGCTPDQPKTLPGAPVSSPYEDEPTGSTQNPPPSAKKPTSAPFKPLTPEELANAGKGSDTGKTVGNLTSGETTALKEGIAKRESGGNYAAENQLGYVGKYQFGAAALETQGYVKPGTKNSELGDPSVWQNADGTARKDGIGSSSDWKNSPDVQEKAMDRNLQQNYNQLSNSKTGALNANSTSEDTGAALAAAHLTGAGNVNKLAAGRGGMTADANGTTTTSYENSGRQAIAMYNAQQTKPASTTTSPTQVASVTGGNFTRTG